MKAEAEAYLQDKYGEEFYVDDIEYTWQVDTYTMRGHLKGDKSSNFAVDKEEGKFNDAFFVHQMSQGAREEIKPYVERAFHPMMNWYSGVTVDKSEEARLAGKDLTYPELRKETDQYKQDVKVNIPLTLTESNKTQEMEKAYQLIEYLNENEINASLEVSYYYDPVLQKEKGVTEVDFTKQARYGEYVTGYLEINDVSTINTEEDLNSYVEIY